MPDMLGFVDLSFAEQLIERGGPVVVIIGIMSVVALAVAAYKFVQFMYLSVGGGQGVAHARKAWSSAKSDQALALLSNERGAAARVMAHAILGLNRGIVEDAVREDCERLGQTLLAKLRSYLRVIEATAQITPLLGLFGTVLGMMRAFQALQSAGAEVDPAALAGGIWIALITTAVGLAVAIPAGLALYWFEGRIEREAAHMDDALTSVFTGRLWSAPEALPPAQHASLYPLTATTHVTE